MLAAAAMVAAATVLSACSGGSSGASTTNDATPGAKATSTAPVTLTFAGYGGSGQDAMINSWQKPFTAEHPNVTFVNTSPSDLSQIKAQVQAGAVQWNVAAVAAYQAQQGCGTLFEKLDFSGVDQSELAKGAVGKCYMTGFYNSTPFAYLTSDYPDPSKAPKTIKDFFNTKKFPGKRGVVTNLQNGLLEYPLLADGVAADKLYPLDVDKALDTWNDIRSDTLFAPNVGALQQAVASKQVDMFLLSDSRLVALMDSGVDITIVWDKTVVTQSVFAVPKGSANKATAQDFLATIAGQRQVKSITETLGTAPVNLKAKLDLGPSAAKLQVFNKQVNTGTTVIQDVDWWAKNYDATQTKVTNWLAG
jgi:putative spermidine/putrescine transport system substrate-binding protein